MIRIFILITVIPIFLFSELHGQVLNDDIENRISLEFVQPVASQTHGCTVQWKCVDESLTGKCIDYHNDQWFTFNSGSFSKLYINIMNQNCRDLRGVQIVVLKGEPCNVETYQVLTCVSTATQDDIYVELDSLEPNQDCLINIDGYLHDYCGFQIEVSSHAKGLSPEPILDLKTNSSRSENVIRIEWQLPDSLRSEINGFQLFRRCHPDFKSEYAGFVPITLNAFGEYQEEFFFEDTIESNKTYYYTLAGSGRDGKLHTINYFKFHYKKSETKPHFLRSINVPLKHIKNKSSVTVIVYDYNTMNIVDKQVFTYKKRDSPYFTFSTRYVIQREIYKLLVEVIDNSRNSREKYTYNLFVNN